MFLGGLGGAVIALLVVAVIVLANLERPKPDSWDFGTGMLTIAALGFSAVAGAIGGVITAGFIRAGRMQSACVAALLSLAIVSAPAVAIVVLPRLPSRPFRPAGKAARAEWAQSHGLPDSSAGLNLAIQLKRCVAEGNATAAAILSSSCGVLRRYWYGDGPDAIAGLGAYMIGDDGWRWDAGARAGQPVKVFRDPIFNADGPIFEVEAHRITARAHSRAPAYLTSTIVPAMEGVRRCFVRRAEELRGGSWDGDPRSLPVLLTRPDTSPFRCEVRIDNEPSGSTGWFLLVSSRGLPWPWRVEFTPTGSGEDRSWELRFREEMINYLIDRSGGWHSRVGAPATPTDPAPAPCYFDPRLPCE